MSSRETILAAVAKNQPESTDLIDLNFLESEPVGVLEKFTEVLTVIGGEVQHAGSYKEIELLIITKYGAESKIVTPITSLQVLFSADKLKVNSMNDFHDVDLAVVKGCFGVAENGSIWVTEETLGYRVLPFICENLAIIIDARAIVANMHQAYEKIGGEDYGFGTFIAGPSKTADIEQSLVIGAHGPKSMTVFLLSGDDI